VFLWGQDGLLGDKEQWTRGWSIVIIIYFEQLFIQDFKQLLIKSQPVHNNISSTELEK
jgi:hypothetical protein